MVFNHDQFFKKMEAQIEQDQKSQRKLRRLIFAAALGWFLFWTGAVIGIVSVIAHFVAKYW